MKYSKNKLKIKKPTNNKDKLKIKKKNVRY